jgi:hypothetical protein
VAWMAVAMAPQECDLVRREALCTFLGTCALTLVGQQTGRQHYGNIIHVHNACVIYFCNNMQKVEHFSALRPHRPACFDFFSERPTLKLYWYVH